MAKYYCVCGSVNKIVSTNLTPRELCGKIITEIDDDATLEDEFCIDERGFRSTFTELKPEFVFVTTEVMEEEGLFDE